jgi:hypothetical protein
LTTGDGPIGSGGLAVPGGTRSGCAFICLLLQ